LFTNEDNPGSQSDKAMAE
jgi:ATP-dependent DNA helicase 2 subunit 1